MPGASPVGETPPFRLIMSPRLTEEANLTAGIAVVSLGRAPEPRGPVHQPTGNRITSFYPT